MKLEPGHDGMISIQHSIKYIEQYPQECHYHGSEFKAPPLSMHPRPSRPKNL
jgi:hypothetical protein